MREPGSRGVSRDLEYANVLLQQGRPDLAERSLRDHLAGAPDDGEALAMLALVQVDRQAAQALKTALDAVEAAPEAPIAHYALSVASNENRRHGHAVTAANETIRLAPMATLGYQALASAWASQRRWREALAAADAGLRLDPEDKDLLRIRGIVLAQTGRRADAAATFEGALRLDPTDPGLLVGQGLAHLHENRPVDAVEVFREALRIDPTNDAAREGLVEALKARNPIYGAMLSVALAVSRLGTKGAVALIVGWLVFQNIVRRLLDDPAVRPFALIVVGMYAFVVWFSCAASSVFDLLLRLDPIGRHALSSEQIREANATGLLIVVGVAAGVGAILTGLATPLVYLAVVALGLVIPLSNVYLVRPGKARLALAAYVFVAATVGLTAVLLAAIGATQGQPGRLATAEDLFFLDLILFAIATWLSWPAALKG
jgi:tetratricopeptide (TPR) repeat protein